MDLNTLISTIIASTAGLVAIIGGFLVSRVISLSSEQTGIKRRIREINNDLHARKELVENIEAFLLDDDVQEFIKDNIMKILNGDPLSEIIDDDEYNFRTEEELQPFIDELREIIKELINLMEKTEELPEEFNDFYKKNKDLKNTTRRDWYEIAYDGIIELMAPPPAYNQYGLSHINLKQLSGNLPKINTDYKDSKKERDRLLDDIRVLELQKDEQRKILADYGKPRWVWSGLCVLIYACCVGIIYPSTLLPYPKETYNDPLTKWFLLSLFFSQLAALFMYLGYAMYKLTHEKENYK